MNPVLVKPVTEHGSRIRRAALHSFRPMCRLVIFLALSLPALAQSIDWHVVNRFRLFTDRADFERHEKAALRSSSILAAEQLLASGTEMGWAEAQLAHVCLREGGNEVKGVCRRDGIQESYLTPESFPVHLRLEGPGLGTQPCLWSFRDLGTGRTESAAGPCTGFERRIGATQRLAARVALASDPGRILATRDIAVRHVLLAGTGDSIASGEGNPDRPVHLSTGRAMCFGRFASGNTEGSYGRPNREGYQLRTDCRGPGLGLSTEQERKTWGALAARWLSPGCHRTLYGHQLRTALALAIKNPDAAVTYVPLGCSGATIAEGLVGSMGAREYYFGQTVIPAQMFMLDRYRKDAGRPFDAILLTIGANDIGFSGLVADVMVRDPRDRAMLQLFGQITSVDEARRNLAQVLVPSFGKVRDRLRPLVRGGDLGNVVFTSYANPAKAGPASACPTSRHGFDIHPGFEIDGGRTAAAVRFVDQEFLPTLEQLATCDATLGCKAPERNAMTFVSAHQARFARHGMCAASPADPVFDRECFRADGKSFKPSMVGADQASSLAGQCEGREKEFRPYASRQRWVRTPNDSYFAAMSFPDRLKFTASNLSDPIRGAAGAVYGGAVHPTAEGHAAMADAALEKLAERLEMRGWGRP